MSDLPNRMTHPQDYIDALVAEIARLREHEAQLERERDEWALKCQQLVEAVEAAAPTLARALEPRAEEQRLQGAYVDGKWVDAEPRAEA